VAKKKTALQAAQERERAGIDPAKLGLSAAMGLLFAIAMGALWQAYSVMREDAAAANLDTQRETVHAALSRIVTEQQRALTTALDDDELRAILTVVDESSRARAQARLRERLPAVVRSEFYAADIPELITADLVAFGYARANILAEARDNTDHSARAQLHRDDAGKMRLALAQAVRQGEAVLAYAYVLVPGDAVLTALDGLEPNIGLIQLRQGIFGGSTLTSVGGYSAETSSEERVFAVERSIFTVVTRDGELFKVGGFLPWFDTRSITALMSFALLALGAIGGLIYWRRRIAGSDAEDAATSAAKSEALPATPAAAVAGETGKPKESAAAKPKPLAPKEPVVAASAIDRSIFRAYDIRGVVDKTLTASSARAIGLAIGSVARERGLSEFVVGRDGRTSGVMLSAELIRGLRAAGCDVIDIGQVPTPVLYFATYHLNTGSGVMVTGSHNPPEYNGFKIVVGGQTLAEEQIADLYARIADGRLATGSGGLQSMEVGADYIERITGDVQVERSLKVVIDAGNGVAGAIAPQVLEGIGCEVVPLYCEVDGNFPNHHPDPSDPRNLQDLIMSVKQMKADLGIAFDGDGDRLGVVTASGEIIYPDRLLMLFAIDVLNRNPGAAIIYDVKCTGHLQDVVLRHGGSPIMWKTGHSLIKAKMREEDAELAGEMSGHFFFRERWYGFDDGIYAAARLAEILAASERAPQSLFDELPKGVSTPELKIGMAEGEHYAFIARFREHAAFPGARVSTIDGVRADYNDGWGLVRCSNTTPSLVLRFDADNAEALARIQNAFRAQLLAVDANLTLPF
jgi:phosphomannomutase/phosphoglucomutase